MALHLLSTYYVPCAILQKIYKMLKGIFTSFLFCYIWCYSSMLTVVILMTIRKTHYGLRLLRLQQNLEQNKIEQ